MQGLKNLLASKKAKTEKVIDKKNYDVSTNVLMGSMGDAFSAKIRDYVERPAFSQATSLASLSSRGDSVFAEADAKLDKLWENHKEEQIAYFDQKLTGRKKKTAQQRAIELEEARRELKNDRMRRQGLVQKRLTMYNCQQRTWLKGTGRADLLDFTDEQILKLKECFDDLDEDGSGEIGLEEMKGPLLGLGFAQTIDDVRKMIEHVDLDGSGEIEFPEFLAIIKNTGCDPQSSSSRMTQFFKDLTSGKMGQNDLSFSQFVNTQKREKLMNSIVSPKGTDTSIKGAEMLHNIKLKVATEKADEFYKQYSKRKGQQKDQNLSRIGQQIIDANMGIFEQRKRKTFLDFTRSDGFWSNAHKEGPGGSPNGSPPGSPRKAEIKSPRALPRTSWA